MKKLSIVVGIVFLLVVHSSEVFAIDSPPCNPFSNGSDTTVVTNYSVTFNDIGEVGVIDYKYSTPVSAGPGFPKIGFVTLDWENLTNKTPFMTEESIKDFVLNAILRQLAHDNVAGEIDWKIYVTADCYTNINCVIPIDTTRLDSACCDNTNDNGNIDFYSVLNRVTNSYMQYKNVPIGKIKCSEKCCMLQYTTKYGIRNDPITFESITIVEITRDESQTIVDCSLDSNRAPHCLLSHPDFEDLSDPGPVSDVECKADCP